MLPSKTELKRFSKDHPFVTLGIATMVGFTIVDVMSSFTLPRGKGPFSTRGGALPSVASTVADLGGSTSTSTSTSSSHPPHIVREALMANNIAGLAGMSKKEIKAKHPKGTKQSHIDRMHYHMERGMEFGPAHNQAVKDGFPAMGFHHGVGHHCDSGTGFHHGLGSVSTTTSTSSTHLPPGLRRRMMARTLETQVSGSHLGKQELSTKDRMEASGRNEFDAMFGLQGLTPETGSGWTE